MPRREPTTEYDDERVIVVDRRSDDNSLGWLAVGAGIVAALVFLRGEKGWSGGSGQPGDRGTTPADAPFPLPPPSAPEPPPIVDPPKRDDARLTFVMIEPTNAQWPDAAAMSFRGPPDAKAYSLDEMIARIKSGGRSDVTLKASGAVVEAAWQSAKRLVAAAGIDVSDEVPIVGSSRGVYRRGAHR